MIYPTNRTDVNSKPVHFEYFCWIPSRYEPGRPVTVYEYQVQITATYISQISVLALYLRLIPNKNKNYSEEFGNAMLGK
jgi:hypothetical protein